jgi:hypothetical protein
VVIEQLSSTLLKAGLAGRQPHDGHREPASPNAR